VGEAWTRRSWIVDGHNAIFALPELAALQEAGQGAEARARLEALLLPFASRLRENLVVVYDGNRRAGGSAAQGPLLRVLFSEPPDEADDWIVDLARAAVRRGRAVTVVSNDRSSLAPRLPAETLVLAVEEFRRRWLEAPRPVAAGQEKLLAPEDARAVEGRLIAHHGASRALTPGQVRGREREARRRWLARHGKGTAEGGGGEPARARPASLGSRPMADAARDASPPVGAPEVAPQVGRREGEREREAKRRRGERQQRRRLEALARGRGSGKSPRQIKTARRKRAGQKKTEQDGARPKKGGEK